MSFLSIIPKLLGITKQIKSEHLLQLDFATNEEYFTIVKTSFNQNETIIFLKDFYKELIEVKNKKDLIINEDILSKIPLLVSAFTFEDKFYLESVEKGKFVKEIHLINLKITNKKKTISFDNIETNVNKLGVDKVKNAVKRYLNIKN